MIIKNKYFLTSRNSSSFIVDTTTTLKIPNNSRTIDITLSCRVNDIFVNKSTVIDYSIDKQHLPAIPGEYCQGATNKRLEKFVRLKAPMKLLPRPSIIQFSCPLNLVEGGRWPNISYVSSWIVYLAARHAGYLPRLVSIIKYNFHWNPALFHVNRYKRTHSVNRTRFFDESFVDEFVCSPYVKFY